MLASACQEMWQQRPQVEFRGRQHDTTGPRLRVYPYKNFVPAAPIWCSYEGGADGVLLDGEPAPMEEWPDLLRHCAGSAVVYKGGTSGRLGNGTNGGGAWKGAKGLEKIEQADGPFSGIWLSPSMGVVVIANRGVEAEVTNSLLPTSPMPAKVTGNTLKMLRRPYYTAELKDGKIYLSNGEVLVNQQTEMEKAKPLTTPPPKPPSVFFFIR